MFSLRFVKIYFDGRIKGEKHKIARNIKNYKINSSKIWSLLANLPDWGKIKIYFPIVIHLHNILNFAIRTLLVYLFGKLQTKYYYFFYYFKAQNTITSSWAKIWVVKLCEKITYTTIEKAMSNVFFLPLVVLSGATNAGAPAVTPPTVSHKKHY